MKLYDTPDLIDLAVKIADDITERIGQKWRTASGAELSIKWIASGDVIATADAEPSLQNIQRYVISLSYGMIQAIYSHAFEFARFAQPGPEGGTLHGTHALPVRFEMLHAAELMFISGLQFVIYHELGHLNQNHGAIRALYGAGSTNSINEFHVAGSTVLSGDQAAVSHATELAADFEALDWLAMELLHFKGDEFMDHAYLQCAIVSSIMVMFNGGRPAKVDALPSGTHPPAILRMDMWIRQYAERIRLLSERFAVNGEAPTIFKFLDDAAFLSLLSSLTRSNCLDDLEYRDFSRGSTVHPNYKCYMREVINIWSRHDDEARSSRWLGGVLSVLYFTDEHRALVDAVPNRDPFRQHLGYTQDVLASRSAPV